MQNKPLTLLELDVLTMRVRDARYQLVVLTDNFHGATFSVSELAVLRKLEGMLAEVEVTAMTLRAVWRERWHRDETPQGVKSGLRNAPVGGLEQNGKEPNRGDTGGTDAPGAARPSDDVPPDTTR